MNRCGRGVLRGRVEFTLIGSEPKKRGGPSGRLFLVATGYDGRGLLAEMRATVYAPEHRSGLTYEAVTGRIAIVVGAIVAVIVSI